MTKPQIQRTSSKPNKRHNARRYAMQALYQWQLNQADAASIVQDFVEEHVLADTDHSYFQTLVTETVLHVETLDQAINPVLDRAITGLNPVELAILRLAVYELKYRIDIPYRVVINEALELAKEFGAEQGYKYINGVLNSVAKTLRSIEFGHRNQ